MTGGGGGSEDESPDTPVRTEASGTMGTVTLDGADNSVPSVQIGTTDREPNLLNGSEDESRCQALSVLVVETGQIASVGSLSTRKTTYTS